MRKNVLGVAGLTMLLAAGLTAALIGFAASPARAGSSVCSDATHTCTWDGNGTNASSCQNITAGTGILWIFTGAATPTDLVVTWSTGETDTITGWVQQGNGSWHLQTNLVGSFPPTSAYVDFTGTNGSTGATLTISGCNEGGPPGTTTTVTTTTTTTTTTQTTTTTPTATIQIVKTADAAQVNAGQPIGFTLTVFNPGGADAHGVKLSDTLPTNTGLSWSIDAQGAGWGGSCSIGSGVLSCGGASGVTVPAGTSQAASTFTVHVTSPTSGATGGDCPGGSGVVSNTGAVSTSNAGSDQSGASTCVQALVDLAVTKSGSPATQLLGQGNITWTMVVTNNGPSTATGVQIADPMPAGNTYVSASSTQGTCTGGAILNCNIGTMAAGASVTITLVTTPSAAGTQSNTVTVTAQTPETNTGNNTATASVEVTAPLTPPAVFCVAVSKVTPKQLFVGRKTTLTIHVTRHGKAVKGIRVTIKGPKLNIRTKASNSKGVIKKTVKLKKAGVLVFSPIASKRCNTKRVGVTGVFTPPVTG
jgi:uncharacterized repeat protein (TIGR01451 family)